MHQSQNNYYKQVTPQVDDLIRRIKPGVSFMRDELQEMMELKTRKNFRKKISEPCLGTRMDRNDYSPKTQ